MLADLEVEATPLRRLLAFGAVFLGMLALANGAFARQPPLLSPPSVLAIVLLAGTGGLLIWVNGRWARAMFWATAGMGALVWAGTYAAWVGAALAAWANLALGVAALAFVGALMAAVWLIRPLAWLALPVLWARRAVVALAAVGLLIPGPERDGALAAGAAGPFLAMGVWTVALLLVALLRPVEEEDEETGEAEA